jgi:hypothetical protein
VAERRDQRGPVTAANIEQPGWLLRRVDAGESFGDRRVQRHVPAPADEGDEGLGLVIHRTVMAARQVGGKRAAEQGAASSTVGGTPRAGRIASCECVQGLEHKILIFHHLKHAMRRRRTRGAPEEHYETQIVHYAFEVAAGSRGKPFLRRPRPLKPGSC